MVRTFLLSVCSISLVLCIASYSCAELIDNGDGTISQIRSDGSELMWTKDTLLAGDSGLPEGKKNWKEAKDWAANLNFADYNDWRLPTTPGTVTNGITTEGELGELYHSELGELRNVGLFTMSDKHNNVFWTETEFDETSVFIVNFGNFKGKYKYSFQQTCSAEDSRQAWAVRDIIIYVAEPESTEEAEITGSTINATTGTEVDVEVATETKVTAEVESVADTNITTETETTENTTESGEDDSVK